MAGADNLKGHGFNEMSAERQREIASMGGKAAQKKAKERKTMKEQALLLLSLPAHKSIKDKMSKHGIKVEDADNQMAMIVAMFNKAVAGDVQAFNTLTALIGEKPIDNIAIDMKPIVLKDDVGDTDV